MIGATGPVVSLEFKESFAFGRSEPRLGKAPAGTVPGTARRQHEITG